MTKKMKVGGLLLVGALLCVGTPGLASSLKCTVGPATKTFGGTSWLVYSCDDNASIVVVTATGNPAMPFVFSVIKDGDTYRLHGEGTGDTKLTDAAFKDLSALTDADIGALIDETHRQQGHGQAK